MIFKRNKRKKKPMSKDMREFYKQRTAENLTESRRYRTISWLEKLYDRS